MQKKQKKRGILDFIKSYLENERIAATRAAAEAFPGAKDATGNMGRAVRCAISEYEKSAPTHGAMAESLSGAGLSSSGYADYIRRSSAEKLYGKANSAKATHARETAENAEGYKLHTEALLLEKEKKVEALKKLAIEEELTDPDELYSHALATGLTKKEARAAADAALAYAGEKIKENKISKVKSAIVSKRFTGSQAYTYALELGLDEEAAANLREFAARLNEYIYSEND